MTKNKKGRQWDGKSRVSTDLYRRRFNEIFKKNNKDDSKPDNTSKKHGVGANLKIKAEIVNGTCPHCSHNTVLVCIWASNIYRCMTCGHDVEQKINGKISYIPHIVDKNKFTYAMKVNSDG